MSFPDTRQVTVVAYPEQNGESSVTQSMKYALYTYVCTTWTTTIIALRLFAYCHVHTRTYTYMYTCTPAYICYLHGQQLFAHLHTQATVTIYLPHCCRSDLKRLMRRNHKMLQVLQSTAVAHKAQGYVVAKRTTCGMFAHGARAISYLEGITAYIY